jgi:hypothetical protein
MIAGCILSETSSHSYRTSSGRFHQPRATRAPNTHLVIFLQSGLLRVGRMMRSSMLMISMVTIFSLTSTYLMFRSSQMRHYHRPRRHKASTQRQSKWGFVLVPHMLQKTLTCFNLHVQNRGRRCGGTFLRYHNQISKASFETDAKKRCNRLQFSVKQKWVI